MGVAGYTINVEPPRLCVQLIVSPSTWRRPRGIMLRLRDIMTTDVVTVSPEMSLREAAELFVKRHMGGAPVVANGVVLGVVSGTDLLGFVASMPGIMVEHDDQEEVPGWWEEDPLPPEGEEPPAFFFAARWSDREGDTSERFRDIVGTEWSVLEEHTVSEIMNPSVYAFPSDTSIEDAASFMRSADVHRVLVMDEGNLAGIVTTKDITNAVANHMRRDRASHHRRAIVE